MKYTTYAGLGLLAVALIFGNKTGYDYRYLGIVIFGICLVLIEYAQAWVSWYKKYKK
jgi:hypothetical protein